MHPSASPRHPWKALAVVIAMFAAVHGALPHDVRHGHAGRHLHIVDFSRGDIDVTQEENQLWIRGRQQDDKTRDYIHRGIAARQFQRSFLLAEGMQVLGAELANGLLSIDIARPQPERVVKTIKINARD